MPEDKLAEPDTAKCLNSFMTNMEELDALRAVYYHMDDNPLLDPQDSEGKQYNIEILIKSGIIFIVTCWDEFIRELITESFDFMINNVSDPKSFPVNVKMTASENLLPSKPSKRENWHHDRWKEDIWQLAGNGWKDILKKSKERYIDRFNTPRPEIIDKLFLNVIGLKDLSSNWKWEDMTETNSKDCLNILMTFRGDIVHRNKSHREVFIEDVDYFSLFVKRLAGESANAVRKFVDEKTDKYPWGDNNVLMLLDVEYRDKHCK